MTDTTRRGFLNVAGVGAAALGVATVLPARNAGTAGVPRLPEIGDATGPMVAYIKDVTSSAISLMVGDREIVVHDKEIVARLVHATR
ncbi:Tat (twin-arginine translocation) pathway signal sequence [Frankineae bacterium MT45]|nr:Tat (twin-arginine translocation) pathway signal sequence [Frankineae bacterium MT45]